MSCSHVCSACAYGICKDTGICCSRTVTCIPTSILAFFVWIGEKFKECIEGCTPPNCAEWAEIFWFGVDVFLIGGGTVTLFFGVFFIDLSMIQIYVGAAMLSAGVLPWIIYGVIWLGLMIKDCHGRCYDRYTKQYHEYQAIPDPEDSDPYDQDPYDPDPYDPDPYDNDESYTVIIDIETGNIEMTDDASPEDFN